MVKNPWAGKHLHNYDLVTFLSSGETFEGKSCATCGEHRVVTRIKTVLAKVGIR